MRQLRMHGSFVPILGQIQIASKLREARLRMFQKSNDNDSRVEFLCKDPEAREGSFTFHHELTHWHQSISTPFGRLYHRIPGAWVSACQAICESLRADQQLRYLSKPAWPKSRYNHIPVAEMIASGDPVELHLLSAVGSRETLGYLEGKFVESAFEAATAASFLTLFTDKIENYLYWGRLASREEKNGRLSSPIRSDGAVLGGLAVLEGQARAVEEMNRLSMNAEPNIHEPSEIFAESRWFPPYSTAFDYFLSLKGLNRDILKKLYYSEENAYWFLLDLLTIFSSLCDLALFTPIDPVYSQLWREDMLWSDFHPGWRFIALAKKENELDKVDWGVKCSELYPEIVGNLFDELRWPTIQQMETLYTVEDKAGPHILVTKEADKYRHDYPPVFVGFGLPWVAPLELWPVIDAELRPPNFRMTDEMNPIVPLCPSWCKANPRFNGQYSIFFLISATVHDLAIQLLWEEGPFRARVPFTTITVVEHYLKDYFFVHGRPILKYG